uniref:Uncharacterized protein n=1 Tax=Manihot esculenta TaxID=3983 RepID=A0A2C9U998_MANES
MVISWILNSLSKELASTFVYTPYAKCLWDNIKGSFAQSNGPLIFQIKREISSLTQIGMSVTVYFTKLKKLRDELD